jgi:phage-related minor tail protein
MAGAIKGITVEIGGDTTKLGKALADVNKKSKDLQGELKGVNSLLKLDPSNVTLLAQKQDILTEAISNTKNKLETLKSTQAQVQAQFEKGEISANQYRDFQREIIATERKLDEYESELKETTNALKDLEKESAEAKQKTADLAKTVSDVATKGFKTLVTGIGAGAAALTAASESTRDYRTEMAKLDTAFQDNGFSSNVAKNAYTDLVGILGETDQSVEAANHLAKLTDNEKDLATWTGDILPGVFATFGASLPIEGLTEAANETAKVGQVTGPLADALNWAGVSEDAFNESLAECTTEQERQALITETLAGLYGEASDAYKETNADVIAANKANEAMTQSLAEVGAAVEPTLTQVKELGGELLGKLVPVIQAILNNLPTVAVLLAGVTASMVAFKIASIAATAATQGMTLAQYAATAAQNLLNIALSANPIGLIILAITALIAIFVTLWNNCEGFRNFWIGLWEGIKSVFSAVVNWIKENWQTMLLFLVNPLAGVFKYCYDNFEGFRNFIDNIVSSVKGFFTDLWSSIVSGFTSLANWIVTNIATPIANFYETWIAPVVNKIIEMAKKLVEIVISIFVGLYNLLNQKVITPIITAAKNLWDKIVSVFNAATSWVMTNIITPITKAVSDMFGKVKNFASSAWTSIKNVFSNVGSWFKNIFTEAWSAVKGVFASWGSFFGGLWTTIKNKFSAIGTNIANTISGAVKSGINGVISAIEGTINKGVNLINGAIDLINKLPGVSVGKIGKLSLPRLAKGGIVDRPTIAEIGEDGREAVIPLENNTGWLREVARELDERLTPKSSVNGEAMLNRLDKIYERLERLQVVLDSGDLVGGIIDPIDIALNDKYSKVARGW